MFILRLCKSISEKDEAGFGTLWSIQTKMNRYKYQQLKIAAVSVHGLCLKFVTDGAIGM